MPNFDIETNYNATRRDAVPRPGRASVGATTTGAVIFDYRIIETGELAYSNISPDDARALARALARAAKEAERMSA